MENKEHGPRLHHAKLRLDESPKLICLSSSFLYGTVQHVKLEHVQNDTVVQYSRDIDLLTVVQYSAVSDAPHIISRSVLGSDFRRMTHAHVNVINVAQYKSTVHGIEQNTNTMTGRFDTV